MTLGNVFNIQKYSIHDGPGIRTTVFFKGCPLKCWWCHNPESQRFNREIVFSPRKCILCGECYTNCPREAIVRDEMGIHRHNEKCDYCETCIEKCPTGAMELVGRFMDSDELLAEIERDFVFYDQSGGGVTFSGGEPLSQGEFLLEMLICCKGKGIHTAIDTSGYSSWEVLERISPYVDLFLYDIKHMDEKEHIKYTGVSNKIIIENLKRLAGKDKRIWIRVPVIPGINDGEENINEIVKLMKETNLREIFLLPYHNIGSAKYEKLGMEYSLSHLENPKDEYMEEIASKFKNHGLNVKIGG